MYTPEPLPSFLQRSTIPPRSRALSVFAALVFCLGPLGCSQAHTYTVDLSGVGDSAQSELQGNGSLTSNFSEPPSRSQRIHQHNPASLRSSSVSRSTTRRTL